MNTTCLLSTLLSSFAIATCFLDFSRTITYPGSLIKIPNHLRLFVNDLNHVCFDSHLFIWFVTYFYSNIWSSKEFWFCRSSGSNDYFILRVKLCGGTSCVYKEIGNKNHHAVCSRSVMVFWLLCRVWAGVWSLRKLLCLFALIWL